MIERLDSPDLAAPLAAFSHAVAVPANARTVYVSGQLGLRKDGSCAPDLAGQINQAWTNVEASLKVADMSLDNVVRIRGYVLSRDSFPIYRDILARRLGDIRPASSLSSSRASRLRNF